MMITLNALVITKSFPNELIVSSEKLRIFQATSPKIIRVTAKN